MEIYTEIDEKDIAGRERVRVRAEIIAETSEETPAGKVTDHGDIRQQEEETCYTEYYIDIPEAWVRTMEQKGTYVIVRTVRDMLHIYPEADWEEAVEDLGQKSKEAGLKGRTFMRALLALTAQADICGGRLYFPERLLCSAGIADAAELLEIRRDGRTFYILRKPE